jgi:hypothetical protein
VAVQPPTVQSLTHQGTIDKESQELILAGYRHVLANIDQKDQVRAFELDSHRGIFHIGPSGEERPINRNTQTAKAALLTLADNDPRIAKALMTMTHQGLAEPLANAMTQDSFKSLQLFIGLGRAGDYQISRLPDGLGGAKIFRVGTTIVNDMGTNGIVNGPGWNEVRVDNSRVTGQIELEVTFYPNGAIEPKFHGDTSFGFTFNRA